MTLLARCCAGWLTRFVNVTEQASCRSLTATQPTTLPFASMRHPPHCYLRRHHRRSRLHLFWIYFRCPALLAPRLIWLHSWNLLASPCKNSNTMVNQALTGLHVPFGLVASRNPERLAFIRAARTHAAWGLVASYYKRGHVRFVAPPPSRATPMCPSHACQPPKPVVVAGATGRSRAGSACECGCRVAAQGM